MTVKCSAVALIKMVMHAKKSLAPKAEDDLEAGGYLLGHVENDIIYVVDAVPVLLDDCSNVMVSLGEVATQYLGDHEDANKKCGGAISRIGWFHSHPGFGVWMSGTDVGTQRKFQDFFNPSGVAIVVDPKRSMSAGKVEIGAFRTYGAFAEADAMSDKMKAKKGE